MEKFVQFTSRLAPLPIDNIDTDQVIPARFLKTTSKIGLGDQLFFDWRYDAEGNPKPDFILNTPQGKAAHVLLAGDNFGCGSSREHAPWALTQYGFRAVISTSFADIFRGNSLKNSLLPIVVPRDTHSKLFEVVAQDPAATVTVNLIDQTLTLPDSSSVTFPIDEFAKYCMINGVDELGYILQQEPAIAAYEVQRALTVNTLS
ncbi:MAG TPA: 3-isopropylmalate dehydratase small subunit [Bryobacteraceae bacterium]|jgi:3-isopropylmalate/(R)-2-methylmalate dehydratase small subunit|nr:3-isopropylmalate dehydratase small subunit [Bryobacteraceae bacterium]